jgi:hypothetical protein
MGKSAVVDVLRDLCTRHEHKQEQEQEHEHDPFPPLPPVDCVFREHQGEPGKKIIGGGIAAGACDVVFVDMLTRLQVRLGGQGQGGQGEPALTLGEWCAKTMGDVQKMIDWVPGAQGNKRVFVLCWDKTDWATQMKEIEQRARNQSGKRAREDMENEKKEEKEKESAFSPVLAPVPAPLDPSTFDYSTVITNSQWDLLMRERALRRTVIKHVNKWIIDCFDPGFGVALVIDGGLDSSESEVARTRAVDAPQEEWQDEMRTRASVPVLVRRRCKSKPFCYLGDRPQEETERYEKQKTVKALPVFANVVGEADLCAQFWMVNAARLYHAIWEYSPHECIAPGVPRREPSVGLVTTDSDFLVLCMLAHEHMDRQRQRRPPPDRQSERGKVVLELTTTQSRTRIFDIGMLCDMARTRFFPGQARMAVETMCAAIIACGNDYVDGVAGVGEKTMFGAFYAAYGGPAPRLTGLVEHLDTDRDKDQEQEQAQDTGNVEPFPLRVPRAKMAEFLRCVAQGAKRSKAQVQAAVDKHIETDVLRANVEWALGYMAHGFLHTKREIDRAALARGGFVRCAATGRIDRADEMEKTTTTAMMM